MHKIVFEHRVGRERYATGWGSVVLLVFLLSPGMLVALTPQELQERIQAKEKEVAELEAAADAYRKSIGETSAQAKTLKGEIGRLDAQLKLVDFNLNITQKKIEASRLRIQELELDIKGTNASLSERMSEIGEALRTIGEIDRETLLATFLKSSRLSDFFVQASYLDSLQRGLRNRVQDLKSLRVRLGNDRDATEAEKRREENLARSLANQKAIARDTRGERSALLAETKSREQNYQRLLSETTRKREEIEKEIFELESELRRQVIAADIPPRSPGIFIAPIEGGYVTQEFGSTRNDGLTRHFYQFHNGMDFGAKTGIGTPIMAVMDGTVEAIGDNGRFAYGKWVAIRHANRLITLYAHLSLMNVQHGQIIRRGDIIGYMGRTGLATGPHLHFTVYAAGTFRVEKRWFGPLPLGGALNPRDYLPAT